METCEEQISAGLQEGFAFLVQGCPASRRVWPGSDEASGIVVGSGRQCSMWLSESSLLGVFSRILLESSLWTNSEEFCYVWNRLDTRFGCSAFQLTPLGQSTEGNESSLWPTPTVPNGGRRNPAGTSVTGKKPDGTKAQIDLREFALRLWPTPTSRDYKDGENVENVPVNGLLGRAVGPSPSRGSLNPRFVEELMGFEAGYTDLKHWETLVVRSRPIPSSKQSLK